MERDQIIKALDCCSVRFGMCDECPYEEEEYCEAEMRYDALALIRELIEENERLKEQNAYLVKEAVFSPMERAHNTIAVKADTVREMAERVKKKINEINMNLCGLYPFIDQVAKEMLEEKIR